MESGIQQSKRAVWFISILFILVGCAALVSAVLTIQSAATKMQHTVESSLESEVRNRVTTFTIWQGGLENRVENLIRTDIFRLFAFEVNMLDKKNMLRLLSKNKNSSDSAEIQTLTAQTPVMRSLLHDFVAFSGFSSAHLVNQHLQPYVSTAEHKLTPDQKQIIQTVFATGKAAFTPAYTQTDNAVPTLFVDMIFPIFAPAYVSSDPKPVSVLLLTYNMLNQIQASSSPDNDPDGESSLILQQAGTTLQELNPAGFVRSLPDWILKEDMLPLAIRRLTPDSPPVYSLGLRVPGLPLIAVETVMLDKAEGEFQSTKLTAILVASASALICLLLLGFAWWWLVGQRERAVSREMVTLYKTVSQQKQLLDSINSALPAGIVLTDAQGIILHVNDAFAALVEHSASSLPGLAFRTLFRDSTSEQLNTSLKDALRENESQTFIHAIPLNDKKRHYQIVCEPFQSSQNELSGVLSVFQDITLVVEAQERHQHMVDQTIRVLVRSIETVDPYLRGQSALTGQLADQLMQKMTLSTADKNTVRIAANLFQVGMIQLPHWLVNKQEQLSPAERIQLEHHVEYAREVLADIDFGLPVVEAIYQMHERLDGSGYPLHLKAGQISIHARILSVANTFCALLQPRSYRMAKSVENALQVLSVEPALFDPEIIALLHDFLKTNTGKEFVEKLRAKSAE